MSKTKSSSRFENLDSIRTIAFFSTFLAHAFYTTSLDVKDSATYENLMEFQQIFNFGVPLFFVLSGFLITFLILKEQHGSKGFSLGNFYMRRILRIWPLYFLILLIGFYGFPLLKDILSQPGYIESASQPMYFSFLSNFDQLNNIDLPTGVGLGPTWSVSIEEQFYLVWPIFLLIFRKKKFIFSIGLTIAISMVFSIYFELPSKHTIFCMLYLAIGSLFGYFQYYYKEQIQAKTKLLDKLFPFLILSMLGLILLRLNNDNYLIANFIVLFFSIAMAMIILQQAQASKFQLKKIPFLERTGKYTYGLYLYHVICNFFLHIALDDLLKMDETLMHIILIRPLLSLIISGIISYYSYHYFEFQFLKLKKSFSRH